MIIIDMLSIFGIIISLLSFQTRGVKLLLLGRFICGVTVGLNSMLVPLYIKEVSPVSMSG